MPTEWPNGRMTESPRQHNHVMQTRQALGKPDRLERMANPNVERLVAAA